MFPLSNYADQDLAAYSFFITLYEIFGLCRNICRVTVNNVCGMKGHVLQ